MSTDLANGVNEFLIHYTELLSDPAHLAVEVTLMLIVDGLFLGVLWPFIKSHIHADIAAEHQIIDAEHGITHYPAPTAAPAAPAASAAADRPAVYDHTVHGL